MTSHDTKTASQTFLSKAESKFLRLCEEHPDGLPDSVLQSRLENIPIETRAELINSLLGRGRLVLLQQGTEILYKVLSAELTEKYSGLDHEGVLIYRLIEQSHDRGIWIRDLRAKSGLNQPAVAKIIKSLIQKRLIKEIKSVQNNRKVYLKFDVEPCRDLIGGALSSGADLDEEFVKILRQACLKYIDKHGSASTEEIGDFISSSKISNIQLEGNDVLQVINSLLYDSTIEKVPDASHGLVFPSAGTKRKRDEQLYRRSRTGPALSSFAHIPCSVCVVSHACIQDGHISPTSCQYYTQWLDF